MLLFSEGKKASAIMFCRRLHLPDRGLRTITYLFSKTTRESDNNTTTKPSSKHHFESCGIARRGIPIFIVPVHHSVNQYQRSHNAISRSPPRAYESVRISSPYHASYVKRVFICRSNKLQLRITNPMFT